MTKWESRMTYWMTAFSPRSWVEFRDAGANVAAYTEKSASRSRHIEPGDTLLCYLAGKKKWVGVLSVTGGQFRDDSRIFSEGLFPVRFPVKALLVLAEDKGVPMDALIGHISFFKDKDNRKSWPARVRASPTRYSDDDGAAIERALRIAQSADR